jgi:hypothetical protein
VPRAEYGNDFAQGKGDRRWLERERFWKGIDENQIRRRRKHFIERI